MTIVGELLIDFCKAFIDEFEAEFINAYPPTDAKNNELVTSFKEVHGFLQICGAVVSNYEKISTPSMRIATAANVHRDGQQRLWKYEI